MDQLVQQHSLLSNPQLIRPIVDCLCLFGLRCEGQGDVTLRPAARANSQGVMRKSCASLSNTSSRRRCILFFLRNLAKRWDSGVW